MSKRKGKKKKRILSEEKKKKKSIWYLGYLSSIIEMVLFYGIATIVGYLMPNPLYTYILNIYDLVWLGFMAYQPL